MRRININTQVPKHLAFGIILVLSFLVSWFTVSEGNKISQELQDSQVFDIEKRAGGELIKQ